MTLNEILEQAKQLSPAERRELRAQLQAMDMDDNDWTEAELTELLTVEPMTGREIVAAGLTGGWRDLDVEDGATWVEKRRQAQRERRKW